MAAAKEALVDDPKCTVSLYLAVCRTNGPDVEKEANVQEHQYNDVVAIVCRFGQAIGKCYSYHFDDVENADDDNELDPTAACGKIMSVYMWLAGV